MKKKTTKIDKQAPAPKAGKRTRKDALVAKLLSVDDLKIVSGGITNRPPPCCVPCD
jgi:hypothetical protein